jgi:hypothetical protein
VLTRQPHNFGFDFADRHHAILMALQQSLRLSMEFYNAAGSRRIARRRPL